MLGRCDPPLPMSVDASFGATSILIAMPADLGAFAGPAKSQDASESCTSQPTKARPFQQPKQPYTANQTSNVETSQLLKCTQANHNKQTTNPQRNQPVQPAGNRSKAVVMPGRCIPESFEQGCLHVLAMASKEVGLLRNPGTSQAHLKNKQHANKETNKHSTNQANKQINTNNPNNANTSKPKQTSTHNNNSKEATKPLALAP